MAPWSRLTARAGDTSKRCAVAALVLVCLALALDRGWATCPFALAFGIPCPGCGLTRAAQRLLHADWQGAVRLHPLSPLLVPFVGVAALRWLVDYVRGSSAAHRPQSGPAFLRCGPGAARLLLAVLIGVWGARFLGAWGGPVLVGDAAERSAPRQAYRVAEGSLAAGSRAVK